MQPLGSRQFHMQYRRTTVQVSGVLISHFYFTPVSNVHLREQTAIAPSFMALKGSRSQSFALACMEVLHR